MDGYICIRSTPSATPASSTLTRNPIIDRDQGMPLSLEQQQSWELSQLGRAAFDCELIMLRLRGKLDRAALRSALDRIVARHEILRTRFRCIDGQPRQVVESTNGCFPVIDQTVDEVNSIERVEREAALEPFDLSQGPLIRGRLFRVSEREHMLLITQHPIISDRWSFGVLARELSALYDALALGRDDPLAPLEFQYADYTSWQRSHVTKEVLRSEVEFWQHTLAGAPESVRLPTDRPRPALRVYGCERVCLRLSKKLTRQLYTLSQQHQVSLLTTLLAGWAVLLSRWSGQEDLIVGTSVANRRHREIEALIGPFENTMALRLRLDGDPTIEEILQQIELTTTEAQERLRVPFSQLVAALQPVRQLDHGFIQVMINMRSPRDVAGETSARRGLDLIIGERPAPRTTRLDLSLSIDETERGLSSVWEYATDLFERRTIERLAGFWRVLLQEMVTNTGQRASQVSLLTATERHRVLREFNDSAAAYADNRLVHQLFEDQVRHTPDAVAVTGKAQQWTYRQLNQKANQLARHLRKNGDATGKLIGICIDRSVEMIVGLLGILKAGAAYVPLDPSYPAERLSYMLADAAPEVVLTQERLRSRLPATPARVIALDSKLHEIADDLDADLPAAELGMTARNSVYVIYTSGSTGRPKGTAMPHRAMVNLIEWHREQFGDRGGKRVLQFAALSFDVAFQETFSTLCTGGTLVLLDEWIRKDARALIDWLTQLGVERLFLPPLMLQSLAECVQGTGAVPGNLQDIITAGEQLRISAEIAGFLKQLPGCRLHNHYGPTETHVVTALTLTGNPETWPALPSIGRPISNVQIYILDERRQPVPAGMVGEIYIGGAGVAQGYRGRPELTAQCFTADEFGADPRSRLYRTGDLGRWRPDGAVEYLGRNDYQVKIRGYRIELGEIEAQLLRHPAVKDVAVLVREDSPGQKRLVAYVTERDQVELSVEELRAHLKAALPEYMAPSAFVILAKLPVNPNGKLDRRALPAPELGAYVSRPYEPPQGEVEELLARTWQELLHVERIGRRDNFFELGGHSLLIVQMLERLRRFGLAVEVRSVYAHSTLSSLARVLDHEGSGQYEVPPNLIPPECEMITAQMLPLVVLEPQHIERIVTGVPGGAANVQDIYPLAPLQEGILFHHMLDQHGGDTYVLPTVFSVSSRERVEDFTAALQNVIDRHDVLRTAVLWEELPRPVQVVWREATLPVEEITLDRHREPREQIDEWLRPELQRIDVRSAPLMRLRIAADARSGGWYLLLQTHHLVCDHESFETMLEELAAFLDERAQQLPEPVPYRNHIAQSIAHARVHDAEAFFRGKLKGVDEPSTPFRSADVHGISGRITSARQVLEPSLARRARVQSRHLGVTAATLFHAVWALVVGATSGRDDVVYGSLLSGRLQGAAGAQRVLGMFINTLPLRLRLKNLTVTELVRQTHQELVELLHYEQASLADAQRCSDIAGSSPLFSALLNYLHGTLDLESGQLSVASGIRLLAIHEWTNYPVTLSVEDRGEQFRLTAQTDRRIDPHRMLGYVSAAMQSLVEALEQAPQRAALGLSILPEQERHQVIELFNATQTAYPQQKLVHELFEEQVQRTPDAVAVVYEEQSLTYAQLNGRANQLARYLQAKGVGPDQLVALCMERSLQMVVGLLGVLKTGAAYVPLDPAYPPERLAYMLKDATPSVVLTQDSIKGILPITSALEITLDRQWGELAKCDDLNLDSRSLGLTPHHLAYVIYTSGSTGAPKGVMVEHGNVVNHWNALERVYRAPFDCRRIGVNAPVTFDASVQQLIQLLSGCTLFLIPQELRLDVRLLLGFLEDNQIEGIDCTPSQLDNWVSAGLLDKAKRTPLTVLVGGESIETSLWNCLARCSEVVFYNVYGPTECTVDSTAGRLTDASETPHIGGPLGNSRIYILDAHRQPVPLGVTGELYIGGAGVARGYLNRPELTAERFVHDPFSAEAQARMYKTGDLGRWRADGTIEYQGRNDDQVKIRGYRIELGEIEAQLSRHAQVKEAVVVAREDVPGEKRLVAYVIAREVGVEQTQLSAEALRTHLKEVLPQYMVPSAFVLLESLPLTPNGKLDRRALPAPELGAYVSRQYEAPQGEVEEILSGIWQELLHVERVGRQDNFFELGGHSLLAMQALVRIRAAFSIEMPMRTFFEFTTLRQLAVHVGECCESHLIHELARGGTDAAELLERVASMSDSAVQDLMRELRMGNRA